MLLTTVVGLFLGVWSLLYFVDLYFRSHSYAFYLRFVERTGLMVTPFQIRWYTNRFQSSLESLVMPSSAVTKSALNGTAGGPSGTTTTPAVPLQQRVLCCSRRLVDLWYTIGVGFGVFTQVLILLFLSRLLVVAVLPSTLATTTVSAGGGAGTPPVRATTQNDDGVGDEFQAVDRERQEVPVEGLVPIIPGVNLPWEHLPLLFIILVIAGVIHELGHAFAALNERVQVNGFGIFVFGIYPGAFTDLERESLELLSSFRKLKVFCGGIWHNFALALVGIVCISAMPLAAPLFGYKVGSSVVVLSVHPESGLAGVGGLRVGAVVTGINACPVVDEQSWFGCLRLSTRKNYGHCVPRKDVDVLRGSTVSTDAAPVTAGGPTSAQNRMPTIEARNVGGELQCCPDNGSLSHLCFLYKHSPGNDVQQRLISQNDTSTNISSRLLLELSGSLAARLVASPRGAGRTGSVGARVENIFEYACLPARYVTDHYVCNSSLPCPSKRAICVYPALFNNTRLYRFHVDAALSPMGNATGKRLGTAMPRRSADVLFVGHAANIAAFVTVGKFVPRHPFIPVWVPPMVELVLKYLITFSLALALLNAVPCVSLDGQFILRALLEGLCDESPLFRWLNGGLAKKRRRRELIYRGVLAYGTGVLFLNVLIAFWRFFAPSSVVGERF